MKPIKFDQATTMIAENQEEYNTLPAYFGQLGLTQEETGLVTCFELSLEDIANINKYGKIWHMQLTFGQAMQPMMMLAVNDFFNSELDDAPATVVDFEELEKQRFEWASKTFKGCTAQGALEHLKDEIKEIEAEPTDPIEYADALMLLFDAAGRSGVTVKDIFIAFRDKHQVNLTREWKQNANGSYYHVK